MTKNSSGMVAIPLGQGLVRGAGWRYGSGVTERDGVWVPAPSASQYPAVGSWTGVD